MVRDASNLSKFVCERNIERYEKLLKSHLTDMERDFIERRLSEKGKLFSRNKLFSQLHYGNCRLCSSAGLCKSSDTRFSNASSQHCSTFRFTC